MNQKFRLNEEETLANTLIKNNKFVTKSGKAYDEKLLLLSSNRKHTNKTGKSVYSNRNSSSSMVMRSSQIKSHRKQDVLIRNNKSK